MNYIGDLYGKVNGKYIKLEMTSSDVDRLEKEKCELLGIIQQKDEIIGKMKNCHNCKNASFSYGDNYCNLLLTLQCKGYDKWEL